MVSITNIAEYANQEIYDFGIAHCRRQAIPSFDVDIMEGRYRVNSSTSTRSCIIGCMISNDQYVPEMEGISADLFECVDVRLEEDRDKTLFLISLQAFHDDWAEKLHVSVGDYSSYGSSSRDESIRFVSLALLELLAQEFCRKEGLTYTPPSQS